MQRKEGRSSILIFLVYLTFLGLGAAKIFLALAKERFELVLALLLLSSGALGMTALYSKKVDLTRLLWMKLFIDFIFMFGGFVYYDKKIRWRGDLLACLCPSDVLSNTCDLNKFSFYTCGGESEYFRELVLTHPHYAVHCICKQELHSSETIFTLVEKQFALLSKNDAFLFHFSLTMAALSVILVFASMWQLMAAGSKVMPASVAEFVSEEKDASAPCVSRSNSSALLTKRPLQRKMVV